MRHVPVLLLTLLFALVPSPQTAHSRAEPPVPQAPANGERVPDFAPALSWALPEGLATQLHLQVTPANNDGPGIDLVVSPPPQQFTLPAPPTWYGLLPDMGYTWRVRVSDAVSAVDLDDASWSDWSTPWSFRTPALAPSSLGAVSPQIGATASSLAPTLVWSETNSNGWYYEIQVSKDQNFGPEAFLYWELRHGGVTTPARSYTVPAQFPLESGLRYYWRVRHRVQGDGTPSGWSPVFNFLAPGVPSTPGGRIQAQVTAILSGDAIEVSLAAQRQRVRYLGIAAPSPVPPECFGPQAAARNSELVEGQLVELERDTSDVDSSGRLLRYVYVGGTMVNAQLLAEGFAKTQFNPIDTRHQQVLLQREAEARAAGRGLWSACAASEPQ